MEYRKTAGLNEGWRTCLGSGDAAEASAWKQVDLPHNWDDYHGYHRVSHGNLHGTAWYEKRFTMDGLGFEKKADRHYFAGFEGVGSYAEVRLNGISVGGHKGGRTCFSVELTEALNAGDGENVLSVRADHPEKIDDLPWVCGGCFGTPNTEGSQPLGIFRPVCIYETGNVRVRPFGVFVTTPEINEQKALLRVRTELQNLGREAVSVTVTTEIENPAGEIVLVLTAGGELAGSGETLFDQTGEIQNPVLWDLENPVLYRAVTKVALISEIGRETVSDEVSNTFGIRTIEWENFDNTENEELSDELLYQEPGEENQYFVTYTRSGVKAKVGVVPGGVKITLPDFKEDAIRIAVRTTVVNRDTVPHFIQAETFIQTYNQTKSIFNMKQELALEPGEEKTFCQETDILSWLDLWSPENPQLHSAVTTIRDAREDLKEYNQTRTTFGICKTDGIANKCYPYLPKKQAGERKRRFLLNGKHIFINGTCEYEHNLGGDHAFHTEQINARIGQIRAAGFNSLREAHCPHNLRYLDACDRYGILYWAQMGAHLYFANERFRENFFALTEEWVRERRNSPSVILWGIQNESMLPTVFTDEVRQLIRSLDDTSPAQRKTCTCNGGSGSDWNIPQNWSGTYGRSVEDYDKEVVGQALVGEYGQYRVIGKHEEGSMEEKQNTGGDVCEELFCYCLGTKVRLGEKVRDQIYGHYQWIFNAHPNPGREVLYCLDGSGLDGVGVINSKGLLTSWGEPVDAYYMYRSYYAPKETEPMVYLVSHTWSDRFAGGKASDGTEQYANQTGAGEKEYDITVYSNCDRVVLMNDYDGCEIGTLENPGRGIPFVFRGVPVRYDVLHAKGYVSGAAAAEDVLRFRGLWPAPNADGIYRNALNLTAGEGEYSYRINCGGEAYTDALGAVWSADEKYREGGFGWKSWGMDYDDVDDALGSVRRIDVPIRNSLDQELFQSYRYGREKLCYELPAEPGTYEIELYFTEPWYGVGGGMNCAGWRVFDVAVNGNTVLRDLDIWKESGCQNGLKKTVKASAQDGRLRIHFPKIKSGQAVICAIAVKKQLRPER